MSFRPARFGFLVSYVVLGVGCGATVADGGGASEDPADDVPLPCAVEERSCGDAVDGVSSVQFCTLDDAGDEQWSACCEYDIAACQCPTPWAEDQEPCDTPLVLAFDGEPVAFDVASGGDFDLTRERVSVAMDWPTAATPWLALDVDGDGAIEDGSELFGSATRLGAGFARNGFEALGALDANGDGVLDARDPAFAKLVVWRDADRNRASSASELTPATSELTSIELRYSVEKRCDARGNCEVERAVFHHLDANGAEKVGAVVDVHLKRQL